jgi:hypothetical protein
MSLREAILEAERLGIRHEHVNRTGELKFFRPDGRMVLVNGRKKDAAPVLVSLLRQADRAAAR